MWRDLWARMSGARGFFRYVGACNSAMQSIDSVSQSYMGRIMSNDAANRLAAIQAMMSTGARPVHMERHSLILWGLVAGGLAGFMDPVVKHLALASVAQRAFFVLCSLAITLAIAGYVDVRLTRRRRAQRAETLPFVQAQITKIWWVLIGLGTLLTFATFSFGGGYFVYPVWLAIFGLGLYIHGLFSEQLPEWVGVGMILLAVIPLAMHTGYVQMRWLDASAFGCGMPVLAYMLDGGRRAAFLKRLGQSLIWLTAVLVPAVAAMRLDTVQVGQGARHVELANFTSQDQALSRVVVHLPAGTTVPLAVTIRGDVFSSEPNARIGLVLTRPVDVLLDHGETSGYFRTSSGGWRLFKGNLFIPTLKFQSTLDPGRGPAASTDMTVMTQRLR